MRARFVVTCLALLLFGCRGSKYPETLTLAMDHDVTTLDPHAHDDSVTHSVLSNVYSALVTFDRDMHIVGALAESWSNPSERIWRFQLRTGVTFHDGRPMSSADVKYSLERGLRMKSARYLNGINKIVTVSPSVIELHTAVPDPVVLNKLAVVGIVPEGTPDNMVSPTGTGAYRVVERVPGKALRVSAHEKYWGGRPYIESAVFKVIAEPVERARALAKGEVHLVREVPRREIESAGSGTRFVTYPGLGVIVLGVNFKFPGPLQSRDVREAIYWALDPYDLIRRSGIEAVPADQIVPPAVFGYLPGRQPPRPQSGRARELLERAGFAEGFDVTLDMPSSAAGNVGPVLAAQLERIGIRTKVVSLEWPEFSARLHKNESAFFSMGWACYGDASDILDAVLHTRNSAGYGSSNFGGYSNPKLDQLIEQAATLLEPRLRVEVLRAAMRVSQEDLPLIPLYVRTPSYGVDSRLQFHPRHNGQILLQEMCWGPASCP